MIIKPDERPVGMQILVPDWARMLCGTVVSAGPSVTEAKAGDRVGFLATSGIESVFKGENIRIMKEKDLEYVETP